MALELLNKRKSNPEAEMSFMDHLEELRWHVVRSLAVVLIFAVAIFVFRDWVFDHVIAAPLQNDFITYTALCRFSHFMGWGESLCMPPMNVHMQNTTFGGAFMSSLSISFIGGFMAAFPYIFWEIWRFIRPALKEKEARQAQFAVFWVSFFFFSGAAFGYFMLAPFTFNFLATFNLGTTGLLETKPTLSDYVGNMTDLILGSGLSFQLPVVSYVLTKIGLITPQFLKDYRKFALVIILFVAAIITPSPDWMSQLIVTIPLMGLYELSIFISARVHKEEKRKEAEEWS